MKQGNGAVETRPLKVNPKVTPMDLAACYDHVPQKAAIARYLRILRQWNLSPAHWEELADRAVMRLTRRFPVPGDLHEIASELWLYPFPMPQSSLSATFGLMPAARCAGKQQATSPAIIISNGTDNIASAFCRGRSTLANKGRTNMRAMKSISC